MHSKFGLCLQSPLQRPVTVELLSRCPSLRLLLSASSLRSDGQPICMAFANSTNPSPVIPFDETSRVSRAVRHGSASESSAKPMGPMSFLPKLRSVSRSWQWTRERERAVAEAGPRELL